MLILCQRVCVRVLHLATHIIRLSTDSGSTSRASANISSPDTPNLPTHAHFLSASKMKTEQEKKKFPSLEWSKSNIHNSKINLDKGNIVYVSITLNTFFDGVFELEPCKDTILEKYIEKFSKGCIPLRELKTTLY